MTGASAWSNTQTVQTGNEWLILPPGTYTFEDYVLLTNRDYGKAVLSGAMGITKERDELRAIVDVLPKQLEESFDAKLEALEVEFNKNLDAATREAHRSGLRQGIFIAGGIAVLAVLLAD